MLKRRIMPVLLMKGPGLVKGERFQSWRRIGPVLQTLRVFEAREVDEIILLDIAATPEGRGPDIETIRAVSSECFTPLTVGGGVRTLEDIRALLNAGADKVSVCTAAADDPDLIREAASKFGSQCITVSIDVKDGFVVLGCGALETRMCPRKWAGWMQVQGAGEILLTSIDRDGTLRGYDLELIRSVSEAVSIPVIAAGGARDYGDFEAAFEAGAHAVAAGALWQFTDATPMMAKRYLAEKGIPVRL